MSLASATTTSLEAASKSTRFEACLRSVYAQAYNVSYRLTGNSSDASDLLQEASIRAFRFFHRYDQSLPFISWFYRIISNAHVDMIRRRRINNLISLDSGAKDGSATIDVEDRSANIEHELTKELFSTEIQLALNNVNPGFRMAVILADVEGLSYEEVAAAMGTSVGTVRSRIHRGRLQMRKYLMKHFPAKFGGVGHYVL